jgi:hypothetical protein
MAVWGVHGGTFSSVCHGPKCAEYGQVGIVRSYTFPPSAVVGLSQSQSGAALATAYCSNFDLSKVPGSVFCAPTFLGTDSVIVVAPVSSDWAANYEFRMPLVSFPDSSLIELLGPSFSASSPSSGGTVALAPGAVVTLDAGPKYSYSDITEFSGIAFLALASVWALRNLVLRFVLPH